MNQRVVTRIDAHVAQVSLVRTDKSNALDGAMFDALIEAGTALMARREVRAVVLHGEGSGFCAGIDMQVLADMEAGHIAGTRDLRTRTHGLCNRFQYAAWVWRELPVPVIAAVHGYALGGGLELALGADLRYTTADARMSVMEVSWGLVPDMGGTLRLQELVRDDLARELAYTGRVFDGTEAVSLGLATRAEADPLRAALDTARAIAARSPDAVRAMKRLLSGRASPGAAQQLAAETVEQQALLGTRNEVETVAASRQRRAPVFVD